MNSNKIIPSLWFHTDEGKISNLLEYYKNIFGADWGQGPVIPLGKTPGGNTEMCEVSIFGHKYSFMSTAEVHHEFNDAVSFTIICEDQGEIDKYWNYFTSEGQQSQCGWCQDKFGLRWQVIPVNFGELMSKPNAWGVMMKQRKIVIDEYLERR